MELKEKATVSEASKGAVILVTGRAELAKQIKRLVADKEELQTSLDEAVKEKEKSKRNEKESEKQVVILMNRVAEDGKITDFCNNPGPLFSSICLTKA